MPGLTVRTSKSGGVHLPSLMSKESNWLAPPFRNRKMQYSPRPREKRQKHLLDDLPVRERRIVIEQLVKPSFFLNLDSIFDQLAVEQSGCLHRGPREIAIGLVAVGLSETGEQKPQRLEILA